MELQGLTLAEPANDTGGADAPGSEPTVPLTRAAAHAALDRVLPVLERYARRLVRGRSARRLTAREDLVQFAAVVALSRFEEGQRSGEELPDWWRDECRMAAYLRGAMWRQLKRVQRDEPPTRDLTLQVPVEEEGVPCDGRALARACLAGIRARDLRLLVMHGQGRGYEELTARFGASAWALAKRKIRALDVLRSRCRRCSSRLESGCPFVSRDWLTQ